MTYVLSQLPTCFKEKDFLLDIYFLNENNKNSIENKITYQNSQQEKLKYFDFNQSNTPKSKYPSFIETISFYIKTCKSVSNSRKNSETVQ